MCLALFAVAGGCAGHRTSISAALPPPPPIVPAMETGQQVLPPFGFIAFCLVNLDACQGGTDDPRPLALDEAMFGQMVAVNDAVNALPEVSDEDLFGREEYWTYAGQRGGDCEDLALEKRRRLVAAGWPADALLLATAHDEAGNGHAVLVVTSAEGDYVLDNKRKSVSLWSDLPYHWRTRQSRARPYVWLNIDPHKAAATPMAEYPPLGSPVPFLPVASGAAMAGLRPSSPASPVFSPKTEEHHTPEARK